MTFEEKLVNVNTTPGTYTCKKMLLKCHRADHVQKRNVNCCVSFALKYKCCKELCTSPPVAFLIYFD